MLYRVAAETAACAIDAARADMPLYVAVDARGLVHTAGVRVGSDDVQVYPRSWDRGGLRAAIEQALHDCGARLLVERARRLDRGGDAGVIRVREAPVGTWTVIDGPAIDRVLVPVTQWVQRTPDIAALTWAVSGCPRNAIISVIPALASGPAMFATVEEYVLGEPELDVDVLPVTAYRPIRRSDSLRDLPEGSDPVVQELHLAATAGDRAESRRRAAAAALCQYVLAEAWDADRDDIVA